MDACYRSGGEGFAVLLPERERPIALRVAERVRSVVEGSDFSIKQRHSGTAISVSIGIATLSEEADKSPGEFLKKSDEALSTSMRHGRNRVSYSLIASC